ncbi:uncharacterized protein LOC132155482 [Carassius carassius]|uniref:uncharacterized protein LOC132155482 n=1 Tax=Carassius carassius TaxID=217509 RepID=UPI002869049E|nr:uncharacterized protein LOC132155482 [Carassius carassius]
MDLADEEEDRDSPSAFLLPDPTANPTSAAAALPRRKRGQHCERPKRRLEVAGTGGGPPPASFTPAEDLALEINKGRPVLEGIEGGTSSKMISRSIRSEYIKDSVCFMHPPDIMLPGEGPSVEEDEETVSVCSRRPEDADTVLEPSQSGTTCDKNPENIKGVYKRYLLKQMEAIDIDIQYKKLKMRKLELEIQQLQKNANSL